MSDVQRLLDSRLVRGAGALWPAATSAPFLDAIGTGTLPAAAFDRWLVQDYLFVRDLLRFQALTLARAPRAGHAALAAGIGALHAELSWFEDHAARRGLDLNAPAHPVCRRYTDFLLARAVEQPFEVLAAVLYGVELTYLAAWSALRVEGPYAEFIARWTTPAFAAYVGELLALAERHPHPAQQAEFDAALRHERDFWRMTWEG